ncbi:AraC family transcriptional regulator [Desulfovibrio aminophilus]|nr:AraC family transcriptional regulator [Desulfovibrio aminophilus]
MIPDGNVDLLIALTDSDCRIHLYGPATRPLFVATSGETIYLGVRFHPGQALRLADLSHADLLNARVRLDSLCGVSRTELGERLIRKRDLAGMRDLLIRLFLHAEPGFMADPLCRRAATLARNLDGGTDVARIACEAGASVRTLERAFKAHLGLSPKMLLRLIRLQKALEGLGGPPSSRAGLAAACGYADQAHMIHEFNALTGRPPGQVAQAQRRMFAVEAVPADATLIRME